MLTINTREARVRFSNLLNEAERGQTVSITRHGKVVAKLVPADKDGSKSFPDLSEFRKSIHVSPGAPSSAELVRQDRGDL